MFTVFTIFTIFTMIGAGEMIIIAAAAMAVGIKPVAGILQTFRKMSHYRMDVENTVIKYIDTVVENTDDKSH